MTTFLPISLLSHHQYGRKSVLLASQLHLFFRRINEYIRAPLAAERIRVYRSIRGLRELGGLRDKSSLTRIGSRSDQPLLTSLYFSRVSSPYRLVNASEYAKNAPEFLVSSPFPSSLGWNRIISIVKATVNIPPWRIDIFIHISSRRTKRETVLDR